jgi:hypothetical protein
MAHWCYNCGRQYAENRAFGNACGCRLYENVVVGQQEEAAPAIVHEPIRDQHRRRNYHDINFNMGGRGNVNIQRIPYGQPGWRPHVIQVRDGYAAGAPRVILQETLHMWELEWYEVDQIGWRAQYVLQPQPQPWQNQMAGQYPEQVYWFQQIHYPQQPQYVQQSFHDLRLAQIDRDAAFALELANQQELRRRRNLAQGRDPYASDSD